MTPDARKIETIVTPSEREELLEAMLLDVQELTFTPRGDPWPAAGLVDTGIGSFRLP